MANIVFNTSNGNANVGGSWVGGTAPGTGDTAVFTATSGNCTLPASTTVTWGGCDFSGLGASSYSGVFTFAATTSILTIGGASLGVLTLVPGMTLTLSAIGQVNMVASTASTTYQITTAGLTMPNININAGASTTIQHADNVTATGATITFTTGIHDWNSKTITAAVYAGSGSATRSVLPGSGAMTLTSTGTAWSWATVTGLTVNANTATVTCSGAGATFSSGSVNWNGLTPVFTGSGTKTFTVTTPTFGAVTVTGSANKTDIFSISGNFTTTGAFTVTGNSLINRPLVQSSVVGTARTISAASVSLTNCDLEDISCSGAAAPWSGTSVGDALGNTNLNPTAPVTRYGVAAGNGSSTATWSTTSGGAGGASVPLPQDTMILDGNSGAGTYTMDMPRLGVSLACTGFTRTLACTSTANTLFGSLTLASGMTFTQNQAFTLAGRSGTATINLAGLSPGIGGQWTINGPGGVYTLQAALTSLSTLTIANGTYADAGFTTTTTIFLTTTGTHSLNMTGNLVLTSTAAVTVFSVANGTLTAISLPPTITVSVASTSSRTFVGSGQTYGTLTYTVANSPGPLAISNNGGTIGTLNIGSGRVWTNTSSTTCTINNVVTTAASNGYQWFPGVSGNYASLPNASWNQFAGSFTLEALVAPVNWSVVQMLISKSPGGTNNAYDFWTTATGALELRVSGNGTTLPAWVSNATLGLAGGVQKWVRASYNASTGVAQFFTSPDRVTWTQLGTNVPGTATTPFASTGVVEFGSNVVGTGNLFQGAFYEAAGYNSALGNGTGSPVFDANFATKTPCAIAFTESSANAATVTINGAMAQAGDGSIVLNSSTPGTQATMSSTSNQTLNYLIYQDSKVQGGGIWSSGPFYNSVSNNTGWNILRVLSAALAVATSASTARTAQTVKSLAVSTAASVTRTARVVKAFSVLSSIAFQRSLGTTKPLAMTTTESAVKAPALTRTASVATSATTTRTVGTAKSLTVTTVVGSLIGQARKLVVSLTVATAATAQRALGLVRQPSVTTNANTSRSLATSRALSASTAVTQAKTVRTVKMLAVATLSSFTRSVALSKALGVVTSVAASAIKTAVAYAKTVNLAVTTSANTARRISSAKTLTVSTTVVYTRAVTTTRNLAVSTASAFRRAVGVIRSLLVGTSTTSTETFIPRPPPSTAPVFIVAQPRAFGVTASSRLISVQAQPRTLTVKAAPMSNLATIPAVVTQSPTEDITWPIDLSALLNGTAPLRVSCTLTDQTTRSTITLADATQVTGNVANQRVRAVLADTHIYRLVVFVTPGGSTNVLNSVLTIKCTY
jgi:hypothetical protein